MYLGKSGCIRVKCVHSRKIVAFRQKWLYSGKMAVLGKNRCNRAKWLYSAKVGLMLAKVVVFGQSGCI